MRYQSLFDSLFYMYYTVYRIRIIETPNDNP